MLAPSPDAHAHRPVLQDLDLAGRFRRVILLVVGVLDHGAEIGRSLEQIFIVGELAVPIRVNERAIEQGELLPVDHEAGRPGGDRDGVRGLLRLRSRGRGGRGQLVVGEEEGVGFARLEGRGEVDEDLADGIVRLP